MRSYTRILIGAGCVLLLLISWIIVISSKSTAEKQLILIDQAAALVADDIYILAVPLLEEAAGYNAAYTFKAEEALKDLYLKLTNKGDFISKYTGLLDKQMNRKDAGPEIFEEAAIYYLDESKITNALEVLKAGIAKTGDAGLIALYENNRYAFETIKTSYDYIAAIFGPTVQVQTDGLWGLARADGTSLIACEYENISTFSYDRAIVKKNGEIYAVDSNNDRIAKLHGEAMDFGNYADNCIPLIFDGGWRLSTGDFTVGVKVFQQLGMYSGGYAAAKTNGKWGVIDLAMKWLIPPEYDGIIQDELGRCYAQNAVFARQGGSVYLFVEGKQVGHVYEDARPFQNGGWAAVKRNGKWGFIDTAGNETVDFVFDDALSFGQHLAAVKIDELWGYISVSGQVVIEPIFMEVKSFSGGNAPVLTERGWQIIRLLEYKKKVGL